MDEVNEITARPAPAARSLPAVSRMVYLFFFFSGITALIYEILWTRMLTLVFGHTVYSVSVVLAAFMAGLGFGSFLFGHAIDRLENTDPRVPPHLAALWIYGWIEIGIGLLAALMSALFAGFDGLYAWVHRWLPESAGLYALVKAVLAFGLMFIPTTLMGATLPIISRYYVTDNARLNTQVGLLYALNTLGAAAGCLLAGFFLIAAFGVLETAWLAAAVNLLVGVGCLRIYQESVPPPRPRVAWPRLRPPPLTWSAEQKLWMGISFICGFTALAYEVLWTRLLVFSIASTVYSFSLMLAVFLLGICLGSALVVPLMSRVKDLRLLVMGFQMGIGLYVLYSLFHMETLLSPPWNSYNLEDPAAAFGRYFADSSALMLVPTLLLGMNFPVLIKLAARDHEHVGSGTGRIYAANTLGAICGSLVAGFVLLPYLGTETSLVLVANLNLLLVPVLYRTGGYATPGVRRGVTTLITAGVLALSLTLPQGLLQAFFLRDSAGARDRDRLLYFSEGLTDTVAVFEDDYGLLDPGAKRLITNGISMSASNTIATRYMKLFAHVPILLSDSPEEVLVICFGTGQTTGAAGIHPRVRQVDAVELSPGVIEASPVFARENHDVLKNPKIRIILQDGRNHLLTTRKRYDIITGEPPPPRTAFTVNLYTRDFYEMARARMKPGGLMVQWVPLHSQSAAEVDMNFATFLSVFPHAIAWLSVANEIMLVGSDQPIRLDFQKLKERMEDPVVKLALSEIHIENPYALLANIWFLEEQLRALSKNSPIITDNRPRLEFYLNQGKVIGTAGLERLVFNRAPMKAILERITGMDEADRRRFADYYEAMDLYQRGVMYSNRAQLLEAIRRVEDDHLFRYHLQAGQDQIRRLVRLVEEDPGNLEARINLGHAWFQVGEYRKSAEVLRPVHDQHPEQVLATLYLGYDLLELGEYDEATNLLEEAARKDPRQTRAVIQQIGFIQLLKELKQHPVDANLRLAAAQFYNMREEYQKALDYSLPILQSDPLNEKALQSAMFSYRGLGRPEEVLALGAQYKVIKPEDRTFQYLMAEMFVKTLQCDKALPYLEAILKEDDNYRNAPRMLRQCQAAG